MTERSCAASAATPPIVFEDNHILVAVKRPGILSQADGSTSPDMLTLLKQDVKQRYNKPGDVFLGLLHRLDQPVGGLMVFARTSKAAARLSAQIRGHQLAKFYLAVVQGLPDPPNGQLRDNLQQDPATRQVRVVEEQAGQEAILDYATVEQRPDLGLSLLAIRLQTGRGHQIRVQLASRGWPIVGDRRYGRTTKGQGGPFPDIALFAAGLGFFHPISQEWVTFAAQPPDTHPWAIFTPAARQDPARHFASPA
jgi:23S rRNA pseudouridine1911/1915/1917 synthase